MSRMFACHIIWPPHIQRSQTYLSEELSPLVLPVGPRGVEDDVGDLGVRHLRRRLGGRHLDENLSTVAVVCL